MKLFLILLSILGGFALAGYNFYHALSGQKMSLVLKELSAEIEDQGERRIALWTFRRQVEDGTIAMPGAFRAFTESPFFRNARPPEDRAVLPGSWDLMSEFDDVRGRFDAALAAFRKIPFEAQSAAENLEAVNQWAAQVLPLLSALRTFEVRISGQLSERLAGRIHDAFAVNVLTLSAILLIWPAVYLSHWRESRTEAVRLAGELERKRQEWARSKTVMISIMEDMDREKRNALTLASENQLLAELVQQSKDAILQISLDGTVRSANGTAKTLFNLRSEMIGTRVFVDCFPKNQRQIIESAFSRSLRRDRSVSVVIQRKAKLRDLFIELTFSPFCDHNDMMIGVSVVGHNVSSRHHEREQLRLVIAQAPNALIMTDRKGGVVMTNAQADMLFGYDSEELLGRSIEELVPVSRRAAHEKLRRTYVKNPASRAMNRGWDVIGLRKSGEEVPLEVDLNPLTTTQGQFVIASVVDITERKRIQTNLERINAQLHQKNQEMEHFIYTVSHDLKTPLVTIGGFSKKLMQELAGQLTEKQHNRLERIQVNVAHMENLLKDLLQLSRVITQDIEKEAIDIEAAVTHLTGILSSEIAASRARIVMRSPLESVVANERLFLQGLQNLLTNAIKYRHPEREPEIVIETVRAEDHIRVVVHDNGVGIDAKYHERIFGIFERLDVGEGTGVGLTIVKTIMEKHGGKVMLESEPGAGSAFSLQFPIIPKQ